MTKNESRRLTVINNSEVKTNEKILGDSNDYNKDGFHTNPLYEKLLNFRNLQEAQKKRFSIDDLFKLC